MKISKYAQRSPEWYALRLGMPTASEFDRIITIDGKPSKQREKYLYQLAGEKVAGAAAESYTNAAMQRGIDLEAEARELFELAYNVEVEQVGFCLEDKGRWGCSPDGLFMNTGIEIKCPAIHTHVEYLMDPEAWLDYYQQIQGNMLVTGRESWFFMSYYPGLKPCIKEIPASKDFLGDLEKELVKFSKDLKAVIKQIGG